MDWLANFMPKTCKYSGEIEQSIYIVSFIILKR